MGASPINVALRDATIAHGHNVAYFEREAVELFADAVVARGRAYLAGRKQITAKHARELARLAAQAGKDRMRRLLVDVALLPFQTIATILRIAATGKLRERREPGSEYQPAPMMVTMTKGEASELVAGVFADPPAGLAALNVERGLSIALQRAVTTGIVQGIAPLETARNLRDVLGDDRNYRTYVRTAVQAVNARATERMHRKSKRLLRGVQYLAQLDSRTCLLCAGYDGRMYWMEPAKGDVGYAGRPSVPQHANCRCSYTPIVKSLKDLGIKGTAKAERYLRGGPAPRISYGRWLAKQSAATRRQILGPGRLDLYKQGVPIQQFSAKGRILPLEELRGLRTGEVAARSVAIPTTTSTASSLATTGLRVGEFRDVAQRANVLSLGHGLEVVGPGAKRAVQNALASLPETGRQAATLRTVSKSRHVKRAGQIVEEEIQAVQLCGLSPDQLAATAREAADAMATLDMRVRGADLGWPARLLRIRLARGGYVEQIVGRPGRGTFRIQRLHRE